MEILQPPGWVRPKGYSNGVAASGRMVFVAGQIGWDGNEEVVSDVFADQFRQALLNICAILAEAGAGPEHIVRMTMYFTSKREYHEQVAEVGKAYREVIGRNYPAMAAIEISSLMDDRAKVEIEATAVVPES